jgi:hypothetical protein
MTNYQAPKKRQIASAKLAAWRRIGASNAGHRIWREIGGCWTAFARHCSALLAFWRKRFFGRCRAKDAKKAVGGIKLSSTDQLPHLYRVTMSNSYMVTSNRAPAGYRGCAKMAVRQWFTRLEALDGGHFIAEKTGLGLKNRACKQSGASLGSPLFFERRRRRRAE